MTSYKEKLVIEIVNLTKKYQLNQFNHKTFLIDIVNLIGKKKSYNKSEIKALDNISLNIYEGEKIAVLGKNGSGKTTLMKVLSRITKPTDGEVILRQSITTSALQGAFAFQSELSALDNIYQFCAIKGLNRRKTNGILDDIIEFAECSKFINTPIKRFSSGMSMKLALSISIHIPGNIMIFDEIFNYIDKSFKAKVINYISSKLFKNRNTLLLVSHDEDLLRKLCDKAIVLENGKLMFSGKLEEALKIYQSNYN